MSDPNVREVGTVKDFDGARLVVGVDYDTVTIGYPATGPLWRLTASECEEFARLFISAAWQAGAAQAELVMDERTVRHG